MIVRSKDVSGYCVGCGKDAGQRAGVEIDIHHVHHGDASEDWLCLACAKQLVMKLINAIRDTGRN
jgi:hypothetical protein